MEDELPLNAPAQSFLTQSDGQTVFILNPKQFLNLQVYLHAALKLPDSVAAFENLYPESLFTQYFITDPHLYGSFRLGLPTVYENCKDFEDNTLPSILQLGSIISTFAHLALDTMTSVLEGLQIIAAEGISTQDADAQLAKQDMEDRIEILVNRCKEENINCQAMVLKLSKFRTDTQANTSMLDTLYTRFHAAVPDQETRRREQNALLEKTKQLELDAENAKRQAEEKASQKSTTNILRWGLLVCGPIGVGILINDLVNSESIDELRQRAEQLHRDYEALKSKDQEQETRMHNIFTRLNSLTSAITSVHDSITDAISGVDSIMRGFSKLETNLRQLKMKLSDLAEDIDEATANEQFATFDDLREAQATWRQVSELADQFEAGSPLYRAEVLSS